MRNSNRVDFHPRDDGIHHAQSSPHQSHGALCHQPWTLLLLPSAWSTKILLHRVNSVLNVPILYSISVQRSVFHFPHPKSVVYRSRPLLRPLARFPLLLNVQSSYHLQSLLASPRCLFSHIVWPFSFSQTPTPPHCDIPYRHRDVPGKVKTRHAMRQSQIQKQKDINLGPFHNIKRPIAASALQGRVFSTWFHQLQLQSAPFTHSPPILEAWRGTSTTP